MHGRAAGAVGQGDARESAGDGESSATGGLRVRAGRHGGGVPVVRSTGPLSGGYGPQASHEVAGLLERRYAGCGKVTLVLDDLNTYTKGAFHAVFEPKWARELVRRIESFDTPKHGSWLIRGGTRAECDDPPVVGGHRIGELSELRTQIAAWSADLNARQRGVEWRMKIDDARCKLKAIYPRIMV